MHGDTTHTAARSSLSPEVSPDRDGPFGPAVSLAQKARPVVLPPRRVLVFGKSRKRTRATAGFVEAFRAQGAHTRWVNLAKIRRWRGRRAAPDIARRVFRSFEPDLVFAIHPDLPTGLMEEFGRLVPVVQWCEQVFHEWTDERVASFAACDLAGITNPAHVRELEQCGVQSGIASMEGFSRTFHHAPRRPIEPQHDLVFIGGPGRNHERVPLLTGVAERYGLVVHGKGWDRVDGLPDGLSIRAPIGHSQFRRACHEARIVLGLNEINDSPGYWSDRTVLTLACGGFHLTHFVPGLDNVFTDGEQLAWFRDLDECLERIDHYLSHPDDRARIAETGMRAVHLKHRWHDRVSFLLEALRERAERSGQARSSFQ